LGATVEFSARKVDFSTHHPGLAFLTLRRFPMAATLMPNKSDATSSSNAAAPAGLSRRESQVMDILHRRTGATVAEIMADLPDPPTYSAVRSVLRILGEKELIKHREDGPRYIYYPANPTETAREDVLAHVVRTYFGDSPEQAVTALLRMSDVDLSEAEIKRLRNSIRRARQSGR
jgi:BlaI family penicillinase repressor